MTSPGRPSRIGIVTGLVAMSMLSVGLASANPIFYQGNTDCGMLPTGCPVQGVTCVDGGCPPTPLDCNAPELPPTPGPRQGTNRVCFSPQHLSEEGRTDRVKFVIRDDTFEPVAGFVCQDTDQDGFCGGAGDKLGKLFCDAVTVSILRGWDPDQNTYVFIGGLLSNHSACSSLAFGTKGYVGHL